jgi:hypothetical protein
LSLPTGRAGPAPAINRSAALPAGISPSVAAMAPDGRDAVPGAFPAPDCVPPLNRSLASPSKLLSDPPAESGALGRRAPLFDAGADSSPRAPAEGWEAGTGLQGRTTGCVISSAFEGGTLLPAVLAMTRFAAATMTAIPATSLIVLRIV